MDAMFKLMATESLLDRITRAFEESKLFTEHEQKYLFDELTKIIDKQAGYK